MSKFPRQLFPFMCPVVSSNWVLYASKVNMSPIEKEQIHLLLTHCGIYTEVKIIGGVVLGKKRIRILVAPFFLTNIFY